MEVTVITSRKNETVRSAALLGTDAGARRSTGLFLAEGARLCADAAVSGLPVKQLFYTPQAMEKYGSYLEKIIAVSGECYEVEPHVAEVLASTKSSQGIFCVCSQRQRSGTELAPGGRYLALETIQDPSNLGAVLRTAEALGIGGVLLCGACCDVYGPKALRAGMGAVFRLPLYFAESAAQALTDLNQRGFLTLAAVPDRDAKPVTAMDFSAGAVMAVGNEGSGLTAEAVSACAEQVTIPMLGRGESLNAASSAAILMWEMMRNNG